MTAQYVRAAPRSGGPPALSPVSSGDHKVYPLRRYTEAETADLIGVSVETLREWLSVGRGPARRSDSTYVMWDVESYASEHRRALVWSGRAAA